MAPPATRTALGTDVFHLFAHVEICDRLPPRKTPAKWVHRDGCLIHSECPWSTFVWN
ncbi:protein of unknown function [Magnetospirillum gryphiswaldense MSR-1 v2]|uniref:Uncharacterized protein n=1 Tax=Magnetospirillum gryphiswaldense (strain DSM 6361 / JCM 21280 / NBRC 15271 / MSR-1) TaxID=431944 RepID=V6F787_MAGGM|nr:protein of unknown function [Magnetospirillum gryphiswaldense MSR-1 v2]